MDVEVTHAIVNHNTNEEEQNDSFETKADFKPTTKLKNHTNQQDSKADRGCVSNRRGSKRAAFESESDDDRPLTDRVHKKIKREETDFNESNNVKTERDEKKFNGVVKAEKTSPSTDIKPEKKIKTEKVDTTRNGFVDRKHPAVEVKPKKKVKVKKEPEVAKVDGEKAKGRKKKEEEADIWRWWEEEKSTDGRKWTTLSHKGPVFAAPYERLPSDVKFYYDGQEMLLSEPAEEVMTFYAKMLTHDYTKKELFNNNFMRDWRKYMTADERNVIKELSKCDFTKVNAYFEKKNEERKNMSKEEKKLLKEANEKIRMEYGFCVWDGHRQPVGNYKIEPPNLFRGRGEHPKQGCVKKRIMPEDVIINCDRASKAPEPPPGHKWKEIRYDNKVSWLATWTENIMGNNKYIMLNASARVKAERDWQKYEKARKLHRIIDKIREQYQAEWRSKEMRVRQRAVALYFIDKLALRVGNEKEDDEADTVGCCSLRYEHIKLHPQMPAIGDHVVEFDFLGKDSIRYHNFVSVEPRVFKNLKLFLENKQEGDDLFDRVSAPALNNFLTDLMEGLTAKVFRTYNASRTLQDQLEKLTNPEDSVAEKILAYNRANREVAILCNHQRSVPKTFDKSMENLKSKINAKRLAVKEAKKEYKKAESDYKNTHSIQSKKEVDKKKKVLDRAQEQLHKLEIQATDKEENKQIALGTSKLSYSDPRISVAWCKKHNVPIEKIYSKTQRDKFRWAIHMADENFHFYNYEGEIQLKNVDESNGDAEDYGDEEEREDEYDD